jgi:hypothetical protein
VSPYVIVDAASSRNLDPGVDTDVEVLIYVHDVLPVFTSPEALAEFARAQHPAHDSIRPTPLEVDPLRLATMVEDLETTAGLRSMVFNPKISPSGYWISEKGPMSVSSYCRYMLELARGTKRLLAEGRAKLGERCSSLEERDELVRVWVALQADKVSDDARARVEEWDT